MEFRIFQRFSKKNEIREHLILSEENFSERKSLQNRKFRE